MGLNRRDFLLSMGVAASAHPIVQATAQTVTDSYARKYPDMLLAQVASTLNALAASWDVQRQQIRTAAAIEARNRYVRDKFRTMIHGYPERTPLSPKISAVHNREGYRIENIMFQSLPDFWVTANLYVPTDQLTPCPGIISPCGHYPLARMDPAYQCAYIDLVKAGFVVLAYDPIGQGERRQYWNPETGETEVAVAPIFEHSMAGQLLLLVGEDLTHYMVWDGMRAIDYLETRSEVDAKRIGCAGHSGGGTLTLFISALDERIKCVVVNEGGTVSRWPITIQPGTHVGPSDIEQNYFPGAKYGIDMPDLHVAIAPRPLLATVEEYHPGFNRAASMIRERYAQLGVEEQFGTEAANDPHAWTPKLRLATTQWLCRWLRHNPGPDREPSAELEKPETLYCTPNGSLRYSKIGDTMFGLISKRQQTLALQRELMPAIVRHELTTLIRYKKSEIALNERLLVTTPRKGYSVEKIEFLSEPGIYIPAWVFIPERKADAYPTWLVFNDAGKQADGMEFGLYEQLARNGRMVIACDVRGIGETKPPHTPAGDWQGDFRQLFDVEAAITYMTWDVDESLFGMRVQDVVRSVDYALSRADTDKRRFRVAGKGAGALWVLFASAIDDRISDVTMEHGLLSYSTLACADRYTYSSGIFVPDLLKHFDLPQIAAQLAGRNLTIVNPVDHMKRPVDLATANQCYSVTEEAFQRGAKGRFRMVDSSEGIYEAA